MISSARTNIVAEILARLPRNWMYKGPQKNKIWYFWKNREFCCNRSKG
jgi:hypothetical protein